MKRFVVLAGLELKRYIKALPKLVIFAAVLILVVSGIALTGNKILSGTSIDSVKELVEDITSPDKVITDDSETENGKISAALVVQDESKAMRLAKNMLESMDSVSTALDIRYVTEEEGTELLKNGDIAVLVIIRDKTVSGIMHGDNIPIEILFPENSGYEAAIFKEFADAAVNMLSSAQAAVYSVYDFYDAYHKYSLRGDAIDRLNMAYISAALNRNNIYQETEVVVTGELSIAEYYICGGLVLFVMFFSIMLTGFMGRSSRDISARLKMAGTGYYEQVTAGLTAPVCICMLFILVIGTGISAVKILWPNTLKMLSYGQIWATATLMVPVCITVCAFALMVCRFTEHVMAQVMVIFLTSLLQGFVAGCFIPQILLPEILQDISLFLPVHYMIELLSGIFSRQASFDNMPLDNISFSNILVLLIFTLLFMEITALLEKNANERMFKRKVSERKVSEGRIL